MADASALTKPDEVSACMPPPNSDLVIIIAPSVFTADGKPGPASRMAMAR
jgi:hypothetical protein